MNPLRISQFVTWPLAYAYFHLLYKPEINGREVLGRIKAPFIIIVNHVGFMDSFIFRLVLGLHTPHLPLRFMGVARFSWKRLNFLTDIGVIPFIYGLFGVFVVVPGRGLAKNLEEAKRIIADGGIVVIYPEGKIATDHAIAPFKHGAAVLAAETGAPILPVSFKLGERGFLRKPFTVNVGELIHVPAGSDPDKVTLSFHDAVADLYDRKVATVKKAAGMPLGGMMSPQISAKEQEQHA
ncbi:MAG: 1-acyl-sn-glycerol-3-phosphate acyltransferase [Patescibacteria group bacterium]|nr:1-acyl-sn-glycerol-3-phosphate acyltransferase [Patescibacteria group bacterium]